MKIFKFIFLLMVSLSSLVYGDCFDKDDSLIETFRANRLKIIVLYTFQSNNNVLNIVTSSRSPGYCLSIQGQQDLQNSVSALATQNISAIYSAISFRAEQTTNLLGAALGLIPSALFVDSRLCVQNLGDYSGMNYNLYKSSFGTVAQMLEGTPPNGELGCSVYKRTNEFLQTLTTKENQTILIVSHAFNYCHISKILTGNFGNLPNPGNFAVYDFTIPL